MGVNTLNNRSAGQTIVETFWNDIHTSLNGDLVGRNATGVPTAGQNLGTVSVPWGTVRANTLVLNGAVVDTSQITAPPNRVISGAKRSTSNQPQFITPNGASLSFTVEGTPTSLVFDVNGTEVTISADIVKSSLTAAPGSGNTALVNDTEAADQHDTRLWGEAQHRKTITIDTVGANISALVGKFAGFMLDNGSETEYFVAYVKSATELAFCQRGFFYDSSGNPKNRIVFSNNDTITLLKMGYIFAEDDAATIDVTYNPVSYSTEAPSSPSTGDYWYDLANQVWKRYDGAQFNIIDRTLIGMFVNNTTACVGARCVDFFAAYKPANGMVIEKQSTEIARAAHPNTMVSVAGRDIYFGTYLPTWNITTDLAGSTDMYSATEQASRVYYLYVKDTGETVISDISPYFRGDLYGEYHPHNPWRCVGLAYNDSASDIQGVTDILGQSDAILVSTGNGYGAVATKIRRFTTVEYGRGSVYFVDSANDGSRLYAAWPGTYAVDAYDEFGGAAYCGISLSPADGTMNVLDLPVTEVGNIAGTAANVFDCSAVVRMKIGDWVSMHNQATTGVDAAGWTNVLRVTKIG